jgi:hypothetical protein
MSGGGQCRMEQPLLNFIGEQVNALEKSWAELRDKLAPIIQPEAEEACIANNPDALPDSFDRRSPLSQRQSTLADEIQRVRHQIENVSNRIDF